MRYVAHIWLFAAIYMAVTAHSGEEIDYWRLATAVVLSIAGALTLRESKRQPPKTEESADH